MSGDALPSLVPAYTAMEEIFTGKRTAPASDAETLKLRGLKQDILYSILEVTPQEVHPTLDARLSARFKGLKSHLSHYGIPLDMTTAAWAVSALFDHILSVTVPVFHDDASFALFDHLRVSDEVSHLPSFSALGSSMQEVMDKDLSTQLAISKLQLRELGRSLPQAVTEVRITAVTHITDHLIDRVTQRSGGAVTSAARRSVRAELKVPIQTRWLTCYQQFGPAVTIFHTTSATAGVSDDDSELKGVAKVVVGRDSGSLVGTTYFKRDLIVTAGSGDRTGLQLTGHTLPDQQAVTAMPAGITTLVHLPRNTAQQVVSLGPAGWKWGGGVSMMTGLPCALAAADAPTEKRLQRTFQAYFTRENHPLPHHSCRLRHSRISQTSLGRIFASEDLLHEVILLVGTIVHAMARALDFETTHDHKVKVILDCFGRRKSVFFGRQHRHVKGRISTHDYLFNIADLFRMCIGSFVRGPAPDATLLMDLTFAGYGALPDSFLRTLAPPILLLDHLHIGVGPLSTFSIASSLYDTALSTALCRNRHIQSPGGVQPPAWEAQSGPTRINPHPGDPVHPVLLRDRTHLPCWASRLFVRSTTRNAVASPKLSAILNARLVYFKGEPTDLIRAWVNCPHTWLDGSVVVTFYSWGQDTTVLCSYGSEGMLQEHVVFNHDAQRYPGRGRKCLVSTTSCSFRSTREGLATTLSHGKYLTESGQHWGVQTMRDPLNSFLNLNALLDPKFTPSSSFQPLRGAPY